MSTMIVSVGSFGLGAMVSFLLFGSPTAIRLPPAWAQAGAPVARAEPIVPTVRARVVGREYKGTTQSLDGLNCEACVFENATLEYAGGAYRLVNASFIGTTRVVLRGAAQNTMTLFALVEAIGLGKPKRSEQPIRTATSRQPVTMDWISPVGSK